MAGMRSIVAVSPIGSGKRDYVFAYGSLLSPVSLLSTLPDADLDDVQPARLRNYERVFDVAFPNDGSQPDKAYHDEQDKRPPYVLFANVAPKVGSSVNGILVPVDGRGLRNLVSRERRYGLEDSTALVDSPLADDSASILTFVGLSAYTDPAQVEVGIVARSYLDGIVAGARFWEAKHPGFLHAFHRSTRMPGVDQVAGLRRVDLM